MPTEPDLNSPARLDAAAVYRQLRGAGAVGLDFATLADNCFPVVTDGPESSIKALRRRAVTRVFEAVSYMRVRGVSIACRPGTLAEDGTWTNSRFVLCADDQRTESVTQ
jgi:hypothetical protein